MSIAARQHPARHGTLLREAPPWPFRLGIQPSTLCIMAFAASSALSALAGPAWLVPLAFPALALATFGPLIALCFVVTQRERYRLDRALLALPETLRVAFVLRDLEGLSTREAAAAIGCGYAVAADKLTLKRYFRSDSIVQQGRLQNYT